MDSDFEDEGGMEVLLDSRKSTESAGNVEQMPDMARSTSKELKDEELKQPSKTNTTGPKPRQVRPCRPPIIPFNAEQFSEIFIRLEYLKNVDTEELSQPGDFVVRIMCMGELYGHFPSSGVDLHSVAYFARNEQTNRRSPDIFLRHDLSFCMKFKDLVDNPIVFQLCQGGDIFPNAYPSLPAIGYICLDLARILEYKSGSVESHIEHWIIIDPQHFSRLFSGPPQLQLSIECIGGFPEPGQLLQGNMMSVLCESLHNLPNIVQQNISYSDNHSEVQVYMTLPHSQSEPVLKFPAGKLKDNLLVEPQFRRGSLMVEETTQTVDPHLLNQSRYQSYHELTAQNQAYAHSVQSQHTREPTHWASVKEHSPEIPLEATYMSAESAFDVDQAPKPDSADSDAEIYGDGREDYLEFSETGDPRIVWNSVHRKYVSVNSYRRMLNRLSQNSVWPIEISVAVKRKPVTRKKKEGGKKSLQNPSEVQSSIGGGSMVSIDSNERMIMSELGNINESAPDYSLVYHGIAFVDLSCLVTPGMKSAKFACRVYPFSNELLGRRTCIPASALPSSLLESWVAKPSTDLKKRQGKSAGVSGRASHSSHPPEGGSITSVGHPRSSQIVGRKSAIIENNKFHQNEFSTVDPGSVGQVIERSPFIVIRVSMFRSIVPCYKPDQLSKVVEEFLPKRQLTRRKLVNASAAQQKYRKAILEAAAEISHEFSEHYWKEILENDGQTVQQTSSNPGSNETIKKGFLFYLNASGRYLILREHLRNSISGIVQQKCLNLRPAGFHNHRDFQGYLHDMYVFLVDEMNEILSSTSLQETDPLKSNLDRLLQQTNCDAPEELSAASLHQKQIDNLGVFAEEASAQGDFETCHKLHLQRICRDKESPRCWTEFAICWLSRGNERAAEIAVREALRKDPLNLYALLIAGMIAVRHGDERGLDCLGAALGLKPMAPEILIIVGVANSLIGNEIVAEYFFRKAAYVHRKITGQSTNDIEDLFSLSNPKHRPFNMKQFVADLDSGIVPEPLAVKEPLSQVVSRPGFKQHRDRHKSVTLSQPGSTATSKNKIQTSKDELMSKRRSLNKKQDDNPSAQVQDRRRSAWKDDEKKSLSQDKARNRSFSVQAESKTKSKSNTDVDAPEIVETPPVKESTGPKFAFMDDLNDIQMEEVELHPLSPSIQSPWDVTAFGDKLEHHQLMAMLGETDKATLPNVVVTSSSVRLANAGGGDNNENLRAVSSTSGQATQVINSTTAATNGMASLASEDKEKGQGDSGTSESFSSPSATVSTGVTLENPPTTSTADLPPPKMTNRLGSELIWTANLLINLRMFDFVDGILAKQLYFYGNRSVQFIYLRALSLYLRQREVEALPLITEAIELDKTNAQYHALAGHCYYVSGKTQEAISSYEKALKLPHLNENRHLLYLRYGCLILDNGNSKLAKRVFLHGVSKYPTPYMWLALGNACFQRQEYDQAESSFSEANRLDSTNPVTWGHLALSSLVQEKQALAEQAYKWALRFGLKEGPLLEEIQKTQKEKGFGDPSFPRVPNCLPHEYFLRRMGRKKPFNLYKEALFQDAPRMNKERYGDTENEILLKKKLELMASVPLHTNLSNVEWGGEDFHYEAQFEQPHEEEEVIEFEVEEDFLPTSEPTKSRKSVEKRKRSQANAHRQSRNQKDEINK